MRLRNNMIVMIDTKKKKIFHNGKEIPLDPFVALELAPVGTRLEVIENYDETDSHVSLKLHIPEVP